MNLILVAELFAILAEILIALMFFAKFLGTKKINVAVKTAGIFGYAAIVILTHLFVENATIAFAITAIYLFLLPYLFDRNIKINTIASVWLIGFMMATELIAIFSFTQITGISVPDLYDAEIPFLAVTISSKIILLILVRAACNFRKKNFIRIPTLYWLCLLIAPIISVLGVYEVATTFYANYELVANLTPLYFIAFLFLNIIVFHLFESRLEKVAIESYNRHLKAQVETQVTQYRIIIENQKEKERVYHDYDNHLDAIYHIAENGEKVREYISSVQKTKPKDRESIRTGNAVINAIFNSKTQLAESKNIIVKIKKISIPRNFNLDFADVCVVFANSWDNAIEACERLPWNSRRITVSLVYEKDWLRYKMVNPTDGKLVRRAKHFKTSKSDKSKHGYGLENIERTVKKYGGAFVAEHDDKANAFTLVCRIYSPIPEGKTKPHQSDRALFEHV
ncbi:MAG: ATP-binding protein [Defluviitaleaceae bacterium]|nr:ATP-binding protein [Defluviitaleaceae bacterium]